MKNYLSLLVQAYDFVYSDQFKRNATLRDTVFVKNYINKAEKKIAFKFIRSKHWISRDHLSKIFNYFEELDKCEKMFIQNLKDKSDFYYELGGNEVIEYKKISKLGQRIYKSEKWMRAHLKKLSKTNHYNIRLVSLMANFRLNFEEKPPETIRKYIEWYRVVKGENQDREIRKQTRHFNLHN
jgi:hypothetical protein